MARIIFNSDAALAKRFSQIPWGNRSMIMRKMATWACEIYESQGEMGLAALISGQLTIVSNIQEKPSNFDRAS
jgi:hypothetical protein